MSIKSNLLRLLPDSLYLRIRYYRTFGKKLNLVSPQTFNEKLQWLKLYNRKPEYTMMVDKYCVREYIAEKLGEEYLIPLLGVWDDPDDIDFDTLPSQFVLKCNHNSGLGMCICKDKSELNIKKVKEELRKGLKQDYYLTNREWPYKNVRRRIIAEKYMADSTGNLKDYKMMNFTGQNEKKNDSGLTDYKFFCFDGNAESVMVCTERETGAPKFYFFDQDWKLKKYNNLGKNAPEGFTLPKPPCIDEMFAIASKLSRGIPYVRVDLYCIDGDVYFGEMTFFPDSGFDKNILKETDVYFGNLILLDYKNRRQ